MLTPRGLLLCALAAATASAQPPPCLELKEGASGALACPPSQNIYNITFADYGAVQGSCASGLAVDPTCTTASAALALARSKCLGQPSCALASSNAEWGPDPCPGRPKQLAVAAQCDAGAHCYAMAFNGTLGDNMVLQRAPAAAAVYGVVTGATTNVTVTVADQGAGGAAYTVAAVVGQGGQWKALLRPAAAGGNYTVTATATCATEQASATLVNVTFGDVWYCGGQSSASLRAPRARALLSSPAPSSCAHPPTRPHAPSPAGGRHGPPPAQHHVAQHQPDGHCRWQVQQHPPSAAAGQHEPRHALEHPGAGHAGPRRSLFSLLWHLLLLRREPDGRAWGYRATLGPHPHCLGRLHHSAVAAQCHAELQRLRQPQLRAGQ